MKDSRVKSIAGKMPHLVCQVTHVRFGRDSLVPLFENKREDSGLVIIGLY